MANFVDGVTMVMPWAGGLIPATLTYQNLQTAGGLEPWQALVVAGVVEGMGFVTVTTVVDLWEFDKTKERRVDGLFWLALGASLLYLLAVELINTVLDPAASLAQRWTGGMLSTFGVVGGVMVALRNQLGKMRDALAVDQKAEQVERERERGLQLAREQDEREFAKAVKLESLRMEQDLKIQKIQAQSAVKLEKVRAVREKSAAEVPAAAGQSGQARRMVQCKEPGCGMEYAEVGGKGGHYKKWHAQPVESAIKEVI